MDNVNVSYIDFWGGLDADTFWFSTYLKSRYNKVFNFKSNPNQADIIFGSCFGNSILQYKNSKAVKIFFTGENVRPNLNEYDYSISFDLDSIGGRNIRFPLWNLYVNWWDVDSENINLTEFNKVHNPIDVYNRKEFCCIVIGNPVQNRIDVSRKLSEYKPVHGYGSVFGNRFDGRKIELLQKYRYNICFENAIHPGYHTEKLLEAKIAGCIPIYYGDDTASIDFNEKCFINYKNYNSPEALLEYIKYLEENEDKFLEIASEPLFVNPPSFEVLDNFFDRILL